MVTRSRLAPALLVLGLAACTDAYEPAAPVEPPAPPLQPPAPEYRVSPPAGRLPWPQHDPQWTQAQYSRMLDELWVVNNFGLYQGSPDPATLYLHDALDIVLPNGTPIHAVAAGTVRANIGGSQFYRSLIIEDEDQPGYGWGYTHIYDFVVTQGTRVHQGTLLGYVNFQGLEHIHLWRIMLAPGGRWDHFRSLRSMHPDDFFAFHDTEPPVFEGRFRYIRDSDGSPFDFDADSVAVVSGDVDIVVGMRDPGEWARSPAPIGTGPTYGDRNAPTRVEYTITAPDGTTHDRVAFDLRRIMIPASSTSPAAFALTLYQHYESVYPPAPPIGNNNRRFNYHIITNSDGSEPVLRLIDPSDRRHAWQTAATDAAGGPRFPNGDYEITVRAWDSAGNMAVRSETVRVRN